jgi:hypothetical protein
MRHDHEHRSWRDPTLVLDLLADYPLDDARLEAEEPVRGVACRRFGGRLDSRRFEEARGAGPGETPGRTVWVKAWVDPDGRLVRASWLSAQVGRPRSPFRPKHEPAWRTVELWDFGLPVDIQLPDVTPVALDVDSASWSTVAGDIGAIGSFLWRARRDWKRRAR